MRYHLRYRFHTPADHDLRLYLLVPEDGPGQKISELRLSHRAALASGPGTAGVACFELAGGSRFECACELETSAAAGSADEAALAEAASFISAAVEGMPGGDALPDAGDRSGLAALRLALAVVAEAQRRGHEARVVVGHLFRGVPQPHAWCRLETPAGPRDCDPWLYLLIQRQPAFWLAEGLAPGADEYLSGHEGRRVAWGPAPLPASQLPCGGSSEGGEGWLTLWPDAAWPAGKSIVAPAGGDLEARPVQTTASLALEIFRALAFAALLLVALGLARPGGWSLFAYGGYALSLATLQGRAWTRLWRDQSGRWAAFEIALFHAAFATIVLGLETVVPQTAFALVWIYNRLETFSRGFLDHLPGRQEKGAG